MVQPNRRPHMKIMRMRTACWITKATDTHSEYVILVPLHGHNCSANMPHCYGIRTRPVLFRSGNVGPCSAPKH